MPKYYRILGEASVRGLKKISSQEISALLGLTASQVRQDLSHFGGFGQQGYGYDTEVLLSEIRKILGLTREFSVIIVGAGKIGNALAAYRGFAADGFIVKAMFDKEPNPAGNVLGIASLEEYLAKNPTDIAVIAVEKSEAEAVAKRLAAAGVKNFWNFAPIDLCIPGTVAENVNMSESLFRLSYRACEFQENKNQGE